MIGCDATGWPAWRIDLAWDLRHRLTAFRTLVSGGAAHLDPDDLYDLALLATEDESYADRLSKARAEFWRGHGPSDEEA